jgi:hypothetical protein
VEFYAQLVKTAFIWISVIDKGKEDGSITNSMDTEKIVHYLNLTIIGIIEQTILRKSTLNRIHLSKEEIQEPTLTLVKVFLTNT